MQSYVLGATDGERMFNSSGEVVIKVDPTRSSNDLSLGTQLVPSGAGIPRHVQTYWDETIYVLDGSGIVTGGGIAARAACHDAHRRCFRPDTGRAIS